MIAFLFSLLLRGTLCALFLAIVLLTAEKTRRVFADITCSCRVDLRGKVVVVTGGNSGIGFETARIIAKRGARVVIASRNVVKSQAAVDAIADITGNPDVVYKFLDLSDFSSIKQFADDFNKSYERLDVLINNSGMCDKQAITSAGIERVMQINHVGPTYLTALLLDKLKASKPSRIIFVSSKAHSSQDFDPEDIKGLRPIHHWTRYANSKLCNILMARALSKILPEGVTANSLHPGTAATNIFKDLPKLVKKPAMYLLDVFCKTPEECAQTSVHLAMAPALAGTSGEYFYECRLEKCHKIVTDELADLTWRNTVALIEEKTKCFMEL